MSEPRASRALVVVAGAFVATAIAVMVTWSPEDWQPLSLLVVLTGFVLLSARFALLVRRRPNRPFQASVSSSAPYVLAMTLLGPGPAAALGCVGMIADGINRKNSARLILSNMDWAVVSFLGGVLSEELADRFDLSAGDPGFMLLVLGVYTSAIVMQSASSTIVGVVALGEPIALHRALTRAHLWAEGPTALLTAGAAYAYGTVGLGALAVLIAVQLVFQRLLTDLWSSEQRRAEVAELSEIRGQLIARLATAAEHERRRLASVLHDEALQNMLVVHQDLSELPFESLSRARAATDASIRQLRDQIFELHPAVLEEAGLAAVIEAVTASRGEQGGFEFEVTVEPGATGYHDALLFQLAREFLTNAAKHSGASRVTVSITREQDTLELVVSDDGRGIDAAQAGAALANGHIGLASARERVDALGGRFEIRGGASEGTTVEVVIPLTPLGSVDAHVTP